MAEATAHGKGEPVVPSASKLPLVIAVVVALAVGAGAAWFFASKGAKAPAGEAAPAAAHGEEAPVEEAGHGEAGAAAASQVVPLEPFLVNLVSDEGARYLKVKIELELDSAGAKTEIEGRLSKVRDAVIALLSSRRIEDVVSFEGKALLKQEISDRINALLAKGRVKAVLFTDFVVQ